MKRLLCIFSFLLVCQLFAGGTAEERVKIAEREWHVISETMPSVDLFRGGEGQFSVPTHEGSVSRTRTSQSVARRVASKWLSHHSVVESGKSSIKNTPFVRSATASDRMVAVLKDFYVFRLRHIII